MYVLMIVCGKTEISKDGSSFRKIFEYFPVGVSESVEPLETKVEKIKEQFRDFESYRIFDVEKFE